MKMILIGLAAVAAVAPVGTVEAGAQQRSPAFGARSAPAGPGHDFGGRRGGRHRGHHGGYFPGLIVVEREVPVVVERVIEVQAPPPPAAAPLPEQARGEAKERKPYAVGASYAALPAGCLKMIEGTASYYYCGGGEWYRPVGKRFRAVRQP